MIVLSMIITSTTFAANYNGKWINKDQSTYGMLKFIIEPGTFKVIETVSPSLVTE
jgi:hypothetical protein